MALKLQVFAEAVWYRLSLEAYPDDVRTCRHACAKCSTVSRQGVRPVLTHVGRSSGRIYRTPLDAHSVPDGYLFIPRYGPRTDWLQNVLAAGTARLSIGGGDAPLTFPRMVRKKDVWSLLPAGTKTPVGVSEETELLRMDVHREG